MYTCDCAIYNKVLQYEKCAWETKNGAFLPHFSIEFIQKNPLPPFPLPHSPPALRGLPSYLAGTLLHNSV